MEEEEIFEIITPFDGIDQRCYNCGTHTPGVKWMILIGNWDVPKRALCCNCIEKISNLFQKMNKK